MSINFKNCCVMKNRYYNLEYIYILLSLTVLLLLDLWTKYLFYDLGLYRDTFLLEPILNIWISFSWKISYSIVLPFSLIALFWFVYLYYHKSFSKIAIILLATGTIWNFYDRVVYGWVRDFLVMPWMFIFNVADILLTIGMLYMCWYIIYKKNI